MSNIDIDLVVDDADRIVRVTEQPQGAVAHYLGHPLWFYLPRAEPILGPYLEHARETGDVVESTVFYAGGTFDLTVTPDGPFLALELRRGAELDVRTLETLASSLRRIQAELDAREPLPLDRRAHGSLQALP